MEDMPKQIFVVSYNNKFLENEIPDGFKNLPLSPSINCVISNQHSDRYPKLIEQAFKKDKAIQQDEAAYAGFLQVRGPLNEVVNQVPENVPILIIQELTDTENLDPEVKIFDLRALSQINKSTDPRDIIFYSSIILWLILLPVLAVLIAVSAPVALPVIGAICALCFITALYLFFTTDHSDVSAAEYTMKNQDNNFALMSKTILNDWASQQQGIEKRHGSSQDDLYSGTEVRKELEEDYDNSPNRVPTPEEKHKAKDVAATKLSKSQKTEPQKTKTLSQEESKDMEI